MYVFNKFTGTNTKIDFEYIDNKVISLNTKPENCIINCINGHPLNKYVTSTWGKCNLCNKSVSKGNIVLDCRKCNYYLCLKCINEINLRYLKTFNDAFEI